MRDEVEASTLGAKYRKALICRPEEQELWYLFRDLTTEHCNLLAQLDSSLSHSASLELRMEQAMEEAAAWQDAWSHLHDLHRRTEPIPEENELDRLDQEDAHHLTLEMRKLNKLVVHSWAEPEEEV